MTQHSKKLKVLLISTLLVSGLLTGPVQAHQIDNVIAPLAAFVVLGSLFKHNHGHEYQYSRPRHGHYGHNGNYGHQGYKGHSGYYGYKKHSGNQHRRRARSYSYEGYQRKSRRIYKH